MNEGVNKAAPSGACVGARRSELAFLTHQSAALVTSSLGNLFTEKYSRPGPRKHTQTQRARADNRTPADPSSNTGAAEQAYSE